MKKKSLVAMGLAGVMTVGMCVPVLAADNEYDQSATSGATNVEVSKALAYTVTIPSTIILTETEQELQVKLAENPVLDFNGSVTISPNNLAGEGANEFTLVDEKNGGNMLSGIFTSTTGEKLKFDKLTQTYSVKLKEGVKFAGTYRGQITFSIAYENGETQQP